MKDNYSEKLNKIYPEVPESFHNTVTDTLKGLDKKKPIPIKMHSKGLKVIAACAAIAAVGTFTVAAAATNFFGLFSEKVGNYGLHVGVEQSSTDKAENTEEKYYKIVTSYVPEGFKNTVTNPRFELYHYGDEVYKNIDKDFTIIASSDKYYDETYKNVVDSNETEVNGNKVVYMTFKKAENDNTYFYGAAIYFEDESYVVYVNNTDKTELKKIVAGLSLEEDTEYENNNAADIAKNDGFDTYGTEFDEEILKADGQSFTVNVNEKVQKDFKDECNNSANITVAIKNVEEMTNDAGLDRNNFNHETGRSGTEYNIHDKYFNDDGTLKKEYTREHYVDLGEDDYDTLGELETKTITRHFYLVTLEISSDNTLENLGSIVSPFSAIKSVSMDSNEYFIEDGSNYWSHYISTGEATCIYFEGLENEAAIAKGQTRQVTLGLIVDDDILDTTYVEIGVATNLTINFDDETVSKNIISYCVKLFE